MAARKKKPVVNDPRKPTLEMIQQRRADAQMYWGRCVGPWNMDDQYFNLRRAVSAPPPYDEDIYYPPTGNEVVITLADHITGNDPIIEVPEANDSLKAVGRSERLEKSYAGALVRFREYQQHMDPIRALIVNAGVFGMMISQGPIYDPSVWGLAPESDKYKKDDEYDDAMSEYEARKKTDWPFFWRVHDPRNILLDPGTHGKKWVIVYYLRAVGDIAAQWPSWDRRINGAVMENDSTQVYWLEYWDEHYRAYIISNDQLMDEIRPHRYGKPPFQIRSAGLGKESVYPEEIYRSILFPVRSSLDAEIKTASQMAVIIRNTAWSTMLTPENSGLTSIQPGKVVPMRSGEDIAATKPLTEYKPELLNGLAGHRASISNDIEAGTFPRVVKGIAGGARSGYLNNSQVAQAKVRFGPPQKALESLLSEFFADFARCVENVVQEDLPIWGPTAGGFVDTVLKPADINGYYYNVVTVDPKLPTDAAMDVEIGNLLLSVGGVDKNTFISKYAHLPNPGEIRKLVMRDKIMDSPEFLRLAVLRTAIETGIIDEVLDIAAKTGADPQAFLQALGFGTPAPQQAPGPNAPISPAAAAAQHTPSGAPNATQRTQPGGGLNAPTPGGQADIRNQVVPQLAIR